MVLLTWTPPAGASCTTWPGAWRPGYRVVLPNLYYRRTRDFWLQERAGAAMAVMFEHMDSLTNALVVRTPRAPLAVCGRPARDPTAPASARWAIA